MRGRTIEHTAETVENEGDEITKDVGSFPLSPDTKLELGPLSGFAQRTQRIVTPIEARATNRIIIEAYGGVGSKNPDFVGYVGTSHFWR